MTPFLYAVLGTLLFGSAFSTMAAAMPPSIIPLLCSATDDRYAMGLLWADENADLLNPASWQKKQKPVFTTCAELGRYGPGHNSLLKLKTA